MAQQRYTITGFVIDEDTYDFKDTTTGNATTTESGFMSAADKVSLDDVVQAISNTYTKAETDTAISQATAKIETVYNVKLSSLSWTRSTSGMYYADAYTSQYTILSVNIIDWGTLRDTDYITPYVDGKKL